MSTGLKTAQWSGLRPAFLTVQVRVLISVTMLFHI